MKLLFASSLVALLTLGGHPVAASSQLEKTVQRDLLEFGFNVNVERLSTAQLGAIHHIAHNQQSEGEKRLAIRSILNRTPGSCEGIERWFGC